jgi:ATP-binding cassette subfamily G (WHITE) protein 2
MDVSNKKEYQQIEILFYLGTIIFSIHQPRHSIFELFDTVLLMLQGRTVYHGPSMDMMPYFSRLGYTYNIQENPADFALDTLNRVANTAAMDILFESYRNLSTNNHTGDEVSQHSLSNETTIVQKPNRSFSSDFFYVSQRTFRNALRNSALLLWQTAVAIILGLLTGLLYYQMPQTTGLGVQNRLGGIFFIVVNQIFSTATALEPFIKERALFIHVSDHEINP